MTYRLSRAAAFLLAGAFALALAAPSTARADDDRFVWDYAPNAFFFQTERGIWQEDAAAGKFRFAEVGRTNDYIELYDGTRNYAVLIYADRAYISGGIPGEVPVFKQWTLLYQGAWRAI